MRTLSIPPPNPKQQEFFLADTKYVGYGGSRGGGKSWAIRKKLTLMCLNYAGIKCGIYRRTYPELRNNHVTPLLKDLKDIAVYNESSKTFKFPNGSILQLCYADNLKTVNQKFQGQEYDVLAIDEATQIPEEWFAIMKATVRGANDFPKRIYITCNPGGIGHGWVKRLFITRAYLPSEDETEYTFIPARVSDNIALMEKDPEYKKALESLPQHLRKAWLEGSWDVFMGQFFEEFTDSPEHYQDRLWTHVIDPFEIPDTWAIYRSFDWGFAKPFSCDWWAVDGDGRAYLILQMYGCTGEPDQGVKWTADKVFGEVARIEREHRWLKGKYIRGVADSAIWAEDGGIPIIAEAEKHGVYFEKSDKQRIPGWMQVHYRLSFSEDGRPMMYFFNTCKHAIRTLPALVYSETRPEDLDTTGEDHFADSARYFCMMNPIPERQSGVNIKHMSDPLDQFKETNNNTYFGSIRRY